MLRNGFTRFCDDPEIACCKAEKELEQLRAELTELKALAQAKADGRLAILPCKVGDTIYRINNINCKKYEYIVEKITLLKTGLYFYCYASSTSAPLYEECQFRLSDFGERVFLSREAAEKALKNKVERSNYL